MEEDEIYQLSPEELEAINEGMEQIKNGQWLSHEEVNKKIKALFKKWEEEDIQK
ncbi:MAG TPA: hypothetical protein VIM55_17245 [Mucilaginibacter sp.]